ncbi:4'-phosphopantetheinyl transferase superfamily protein [Cereibacter sp. SYSU M97828]|nr:4'-phosphopantetheinyl transferase superfamily protein [Cereibacter flavus]
MKTSGATFDISTLRSNPLMSSFPSGSTSEPRLAELLAALAVYGVGVAISRRNGPSMRRRDSDRAVRDILVQQSGHRIDAGTWVIVRDMAGKPTVLSPEPNRGISISYAPNWLAVAVAAHRHIGVDLEPDRAIPQNEWPIHLMAPAEMAFLRRKASHFLTVWTLKEALSKEAGTGLIAGAAAFDTSRLAAAPPFALSRRGHGGLACHCRVRLEGELHHLAICFGPR